MLKMPPDRPSQSHAPSGADLDRPLLPPRDTIRRRAIIGRSLVLMVVAVVVAAGATNAEDAPEPLRAPSVSASPGTPDVRLGTELVADGVERIVYDPAGHALTGDRVREVEVADDGTVWVARGSRVFALGQPGFVPARDAGWSATPRRVQSTPDGSVWATEDGGAILELVDGSWRVRSRTRDTARHSLAITDDGTVEAILRDREGAGEPASWSGASWVGSDAEAIADLVGDSAGRYIFERTPDGRLWLGVDRGAHRSGLAVADEGRWEEVTSIGPVVVPRILDLAVDPDGSLWALMDLNGLRRGAAPPRHRLARFDGTDWTLWGPDEGMPQDEIGIGLGRPSMSPAPLVVAPDGTVWFSLERVGIISLDDDGFRRLVARPFEHGALDLDVGPDGSLWVVTLQGRLMRVDPGLAARAAVLPSQP